MRLSTEAAAAAAEQEILGVEQIGCGEQQQGERDERVTNRTVWSK